MEENEKENLFNLALLDMLGLTKIILDDNIAWHRAYVKIRDHHEDKEIPGEQELRDIYRDRLGALVRTIMLSVGMNKILSALDKADDDSPDDDSPAAPDGEDNPGRSLGILGL